MTRARLLAGTAAALLLAALIAAWSLRFRVATGLVDRRLAAAHVPASYRLTRIGPFLERLEDVRIGDPARPDLVARRIDVRVGYGLGGPVVRAVAVDGVRLMARIDAGGLRLGALDRLLPRSGKGGVTLPDLGVTAHDARLLLATPNGAVRADLDGAGNLARDFRGTARIAMPDARIAACRLKGMGASFSVATATGAPSAAGPVAVEAVACPGLTLRTVAMRLTLASDAAFDRVMASGALTGGHGVARTIRFAGLGGTIRAAGRLGRLDATAQLRAASLSFPAAASAAAGVARLAGTPLDLVAQQATAAFGRLLGDASGEADLALAIRGTRADVAARRLRLLGRDGAWADARAHDGMTWTAAGLRIDGDLATGGGAMPALALALRQSVAGAPLDVSGRLAPYRAGTASLAAPMIQARWTDGALRFATRLLIDGPVSGGSIAGLSLPIAGTLTRAGGLTIGAGCATIAMRALALAAVRFDAAELRACGTPIVARASGGALRLDAALGPVRLAGRTRAGAPVLLTTSGGRVTADGFALRDVAARIGPPDRATHFAMTALDGRFGRIPAGRYAGAAGAIAAVPLTIDAGMGTWRLDGGRLRLAGGLRLGDAAASPRFHPLTADDFAFALAGSAIAATATLREPATRARVLDVTIDHDLGSGIGHARLAVPGIAFAPKGLQPERITPLTLGIVANVAGTVTGEGRIAWGPQGVASDGRFATERLDLAAAFGPVTGIRTSLHFADLLGLVSDPHQQATIAEINPGVPVTGGTVRYAIAGPSRIVVEDATWPFAGGTLRLDPATLDFGAEAERRLTFRIDRLDAAAFVQQLDFPNIAATGTFDGTLPMVFDARGGRIEQGGIVARPGGGTLAYVGELSQASLGTMGKLAFDALKAIRYSTLGIDLDGRLDGEMVSRVRFTGVRQATPEQGLAARLIRNLPFRFAITIRAPFRGLVGAARGYADPRLLIDPATLKPAAAAPVERAVQPAASAVRP